MINTNNINILVTLDENYIPYLNVMLSSLKFKNPNCIFSVYLLHNSISEDALSETKLILGASGKIIMIKAKDTCLNGAPTTQRYPKEIYYRIFAAQYLPNNIDRILYLDPDIVVNGSIENLYNITLDDYYFAAASHTGPLLRKINEIRLDMDIESPYINSGVMMMNLNRLRNEQDYQEVFDFIEKRKKMLILPDRDIISSLYGNKIFALDTYKYNMTENLYMARSRFDKDLSIEWIRNNSVIIHYCGRNKPWKNNYIGQLDIFYREAYDRMIKQLSYLKKQKNIE